MHTHIYIYMCIYIYKWLFITFKYIYCVNLSPFQPVCVSLHDMILEDLVVYTPRPTTKKSTTVHAFGSNKSNIGLVLNHIKSH